MSTRSSGVTPECYTGAVPTKLRRIAVTVDTELEAALALARPVFPGSDAALVRELALRGAADLGSSTVRRLEFLRRTGARPATGRLADLPEPAGPVGDEATRALEWVRGER